MTKLDGLPLVFLSEILLARHFHDVDLEFPDFSKEARAMIIDGMTSWKRPWTKRYPGR